MNILELKVFLRQLFGVYAAFQCGKVPLDNLKLAFILFHFALQLVVLFLELG